jgi:methylenetetrahydrofolate--tRNA-(uracil-5-)-methyltransferase
MSSGEILIIGGGLAGAEAAWQARRSGVRVTLVEMKPTRFSPAHRSASLAELVCSNSLRSRSLETAAGLLKEEMRRLDSLIMSVAEATAVPAGSALAVDREAFSSKITAILEDEGVRIVREEATSIPEGPQTVVISTGPLPSEGLAKALQDLTDADALYFYDAIAPIVAADSVDYEKTYWASRYDKGGADYLNCPMDEETYHRFVAELLKAEKTSPREFEEIPPFEGCMPVEDLATRGPETLAHGPMKPVGLIDPRTGKRPYAVVQLRRDNAAGSLLNMVGFQTKMKQSEQMRVFRMIPGLADAHFFRFGSVHRNAFLNAPRLFLPTLQLKKDPRVFFAGQVTGVEGYIESAATGLIVGRNAARRSKGTALSLPPPTTSLGALVRYIVHADPETFQPMHVNFGIFPDLPDQGHRLSRKDRRKAQTERALRDLDNWISTISCHG